MRLILNGCEYAGTTTLAHAIDDWLEQIMGARFPLIHDHWKIPHTSGHPPNLSDEEQRQLLTLSPTLKEMTQRHSLYYHIQAGSWRTPDYMSIGLHVDEAVYGPMYFGYGGVGQAGDRGTVFQQVELSIMEYAPDIVLVQIKASPEVIVSRMREDPHHNSALREQDVEQVLRRFEELNASSSIRSRVTLDTSSATVEETVAEFARQIERYLTDTDRSRILSHRVWH